MSVSLLQIEPTTRCNYTCGFCCGRHMSQDDMSYETFAAALDALPDLQHVEIQGEGEPLLHPRFLEMLALARRRDVEVSFITNGSLLNDETNVRLLELGLTKISVSIESADPQTFKVLRGGKLEKVVAKLERLLEERSRRGLDRPVVGLSITVLRSTQHHLGPILALYRRLGLDGGITMNPLQKMKAYTQHYDESMRDETLSESEVEDVWLRFFADAEVRGIHETPGAQRGFYAELMSGWRPARRNCPWLDRGLYVDRHGNVTACCMVKDTARHAFGRIGDGDPAALLVGRERLRRQLAEGEIPEPCEGCELARAAVMRRSGLVRLAAKGIWGRWIRPRRNTRDDEDRRGRDHGVSYARDSSGPRESPDSSSSQSTVVSKES